MKKNTFFAAIVAVLLAWPAAGFAAVVATADQVQGEVSVRTSGAALDAWTPIKASTPLNNGDSVKTGATGSAVISYTDQATFAMDPGTEITVAEGLNTQDINLILGGLKAKVDHSKVTKPFQVVTPTAVAAVRGTDVNFQFNQEGKLTVDLGNGGPVQLVNETAGMNIDLDTKEGAKSISIAYDPGTGVLTIKSNCDSHGNVICNVLGKEYSVIPCQEQTINTLETAGGGHNPPDTPPDDPPDPPDEDPIT